MSTILKGSCLFIMQIILLLSILYLLRGHNAPGGGFIAALIATSAFGLYHLAFQTTPRFLYHRTQLLITLGLVCFITCLIGAYFFDKNILTGIWWIYNYDGKTIKLGSPLLFDVGIYLSVLGALGWVIKMLEYSHHD